LLSPSVAASLAQAALPSTEAEWEVLTRVASRNLVLPCLYPVLRDKGLLPAIDSEIAGALEGFYQLNILRNTQLRQQIAEVCTILNAVGIVPVWLKGATHLLTPGWETSARMMIDLDCWIPDPAAQQLALTQLKQAGYYRAPEYEHDDPYGHLHQHFAPLIKPGQLASLEVHRHVVCEQFRALVPDPQALRETTWTQWNGHRIGQLGARDRALQAYIQCAEMGLTFWRNPIFSSSLMKLMEFQNRLHEVSKANLLTDVLTSLMQDPLHPFSSQLFTLLERDFGLIVGVPTNQRALRHEELIFTEFELRLRDFKSNHTRVMYSLLMLRSAFKSIGSGHCGLPHLWPKKLTHHIKKLKNL
jgi:hypothetical protein